MSIEDEVPGFISGHRERPRTTLEIAESAVEAAYSKLQCAMVELEGARTRLAMVRSHEVWRSSQETKCER